MTERFRLSRAALVGGASLILSLCAGLPAGHAATDTSDGIDTLSRSPLGHYLAGRYAQQKSKPTPTSRRCSRRPTWR